MPSRATTIENDVVSFLGLLQVGHHFIKARIHQGHCTLFTFSLLHFMKYTCWIYYCGCIHMGNTCPPCTIEDEVWRLAWGIKFAPKAVTWGSPIELVIFHLPIITLTNLDKSLKRCWILQACFLTEIRVKSHLESFHLKPLIVSVTSKMNPHRPQILEISFTLYEIKRWFHL